MTRNDARREAENDSATVGINLLVVIDTDYVKANYGPGGAQDNPIQINHLSQYMLCTGSRAAVTGQGTADLGFTANPGDLVSFYGQSIYANSQDAVILYGIIPFSGTSVFNPFETNVVTRAGAAVPSVPNALPATSVSSNFISLDSVVARQGTEGYRIQFALYQLDSQTGETQDLYGYYEWDPTIMVQ